jgi:hypothetical protein
MTDKSKRRIVCFWQEQKLQPDRPHPDQEFVLRKTNFKLFSHLISINRYIVWLISIKSNIIWWWQWLISVKSNIILISINCYSNVRLISTKSIIIWRWRQLICIKSNIIEVSEYPLEWWGLGVVGLVNLSLIIIIDVGKKPRLLKKTTRLHLSLTIAECHAFNLLLPRIIFLS